MTEIKPLSAIIHKILHSQYFWNHNPSVLGDFQFHKLSKVPKTRDPTREKEVRADDSFGSFS